MKSAISPVSGEEVSSHVLALSQKGKKYYNYSENCCYLCNHGHLPLNNSNAEINIGITATRMVAIVFSFCNGDSLIKITQEG